uniref:Uncharacterized protein n=1 Tax=Branchiostoma floridae TaxID=7739 RepID=C3YK41_BRAFL|eukprot:XP_002603487.1 hypothetical protein BRAFLDRAFT_79021 [Branchiostoma floridae]
MYKPPKEHRPKSGGKSHNKVIGSDKPGPPTTIVVKSRSQSDVEKPAATTFNSSTELKQTNLPPLPTTPGGSPRGRYFQHIPSTAFQCPPPENASMAARACGYSSNLHRLHSDPACLRQEDPMADPIEFEYRYQLTRTSLVNLRPLERGFYLPNEAPINTPYDYGCDRHLLGLQAISQSAGIPLPSLFRDTAYTKRLIYSVSAWKSCKETSAEEMSASIQQSLRDMHQLLMTS